MASGSVMRGMSTIIGDAIVRAGARIARSGASRSAEAHVNMRANSLSGILAHRVTRAITRQASRLRTEKHSVWLARAEEAATAHRTCALRKDAQEDDSVI